MIRRIYTTLIVFLFGITAGFAQSTATIKGRVTDSGTKQGIPFAVVQLELNGVIKAGTQSDENGNYKFVSIPPGRYDLRAKYVGYSDALTQGVLVSANQTTYSNLGMQAKGVTGKTVVISDYKVPVFEKDQTQSGQTLAKEDIENIATRDVNSLSATTAGVNQADDGGALNSRGGRSESTEYFVDGMRVRGSINLPNAAIEQATTLTGGISASYGDFTGGGVLITTRGPSNQFSFGAEVVTSQLLDPYGYNLGALNFAGPLVVKNKGTKEARAVLGFTVATEYESNKDGRPSAVPVYVANDDVIASLGANPLKSSGNGGVIENALFLRNEDFYTSKVRPNVSNQRFSGQTKIDYQPTENIRFTVGGNFDYTNGNNWVRSYQLLNNSNNSYSKNQTARGYARFQQKFANSSDTDRIKRSVISNAFYSIQLDYTRNMGNSGDSRFTNNPFSYGYYGQFNEEVGNAYGFLAPGDTLRGASPGAGVPGDIILDQFGSPIIGRDFFNDPLITQSGWGINGVSFTASSLDPIFSNYAGQFFALANPSNLTDLSAILSAGGYVNGRSLRSVYGIWNNVGAHVGGFSNFQNDLLRLTAQSAFDLKKHTITVGVEFDQRTDRAFSVSPFATTAGLWGQARSLANSHLEERDLNNPTLVYDAFGVVDSVYYNRLYIDSSNSNFSRNLRKSMGLQENGLEYLNVMNMTPEDLQLSFFSVDELLNNGGSFVSYYGYDYVGNKQTTNPGKLDFFDNPNGNRDIAPFQPIYVAGYIEDKFDLDDDLIFRVGVRVDRFDANQPTLKDPYSIYPALTAAEVDANNTTNFNGHPSTIGDDFVVYVDDLQSPEIVGYRDGNRWYSASGTQLQSANALSQLTADGRPLPFIKPGTNTNSLSGIKDAMIDYVPQINVMPRISFSFPISDEALFFAHYDILTERPTSGSRFDPTDYAFLRLQGGTINNPNLKPQQTIDYELGFKQKLNNSSALSISAFYREFRNMIQLFEYRFAYPRNYTTFENLDFATIKGFSIGYDLRRTKNVRIFTNYTLQFNDGTGSSSTSSSGVTNAGIDILRTLYPLDYDSRHALKMNIDYRFGNGNNYDGPKIGTVNLLQNVGFNMNIQAASGTPYTRLNGVDASGDPAGGVGGRTNLAGSLNGARLPWNYRVGLRADKDVKVKIKTVTDAEGVSRDKMANLKIYVNVLNLLNTQNILNVYQLTGSPNDDGFLQSETGAQALRDSNSRGQESSYFDLYSAGLVNPSNFSRARTIRLGVRFEF